MTAPKTTTTSRQEIWESFSEVLAEICSQTEARFPDSYYGHHLAKRLCNGEKICMGAGGPKKELRWVAKQLEKAEIPVMTATRGEWRWYWVDSLALEARHSTDISRLETLAKFGDPSKGYRRSRGDRRSFYGQWHSIRDALIANPYAPTALLVLMNCDYNESRGVLDNVIVESLRKRGEAGDTRAAVAARLYEETNLLRRLRFEAAWETIESLCEE